MDASVVLPGIALVVLVLLLIPVTVYGLVIARKPRPVECPDNHERVQVRLHGLRVIGAVLTGSSQRVEDCSRWPAKAGCDRACEKTVRA